MKICVFGAASAHIDSKYFETAEEFGRIMAKRGHSLVFGAGAAGVMGATARGVKAGGGKVHGVIPRFFIDEEVEAYFEGCDETTYTETMAERKKTMEDVADAFVVLPGGIGTLEEFFEVFTLLQLRRHVKPIAIYNVAEHYDGLKILLDDLCEKKFVTKQCLDLVSYFTDADSILDYIEGYLPIEEADARLLLKYGGNEDKK